MLFDALLFDLDGTLVDTLADLTTALNRLRAEHGLPALTADTVRGLVGDGARVLVSRGLPASLAGPAALDRFLTLYRDCLLEASAPYPGVVELLGELRRRGVRLGVITNKPGMLSRGLLEGLGLSPFFSAVLGADEGLARKPDPAMVVEGLRRLEATPDRTLVIGDHHTDLRAGQAAGCRTCFCHWGFGQDDGLTPDLRAASVAELGRLLGAG